MRRWDERWVEKWGEKWGETVTRRRIAIARAMGKDPEISIPEIAEEIGLGITATENHVRAMREAGAIRHVGPAKGGYWEVL